MMKDTAELLTIEGREVRVTNPDKPYFSKQTSSRNSISCITICRSRRALLLESAIAL